MSLRLVKTKKRIKNTLYDMKSVKNIGHYSSRFLKCVDTLIMSEKPMTCPLQSRIKNYWKNMNPFGKNKQHHRKK